jgi:hypothetical protein
LDASHKFSEHAGVRPAALAAGDLARVQERRLHVLSQLCKAAVSSGVAAAPHATSTSAREASFGPVQQMGAERHRAAVVVSQHVRGAQLPVIEQVVQELPCTSSDTAWSESLDDSP